MSAVLTSAVYLKYLAKILPPLQGIFIRGRREGGVIFLALKLGMNSKVGYGWFSVQVWRRGDISLPKALVPSYLRLYFLAIGHHITSLTSSSWAHFFGTYLTLTCQYGGRTEYLGSYLVNATSVVKLAIIC